MREIVSPLAGIRSPFTSRPGLSPSVLLTWFLATGVWNASGYWLDGVRYPTAPFFLAGGGWNRVGFWIDDEVYP